MLNFFKTKKGKIPVVREVYWEFAPGVAYVAVWHGRWRKKWYKGYELKLSIHDDINNERINAWKPIDHIVYGNDVEKDLKNIN